MKQPSLVYLLPDDRSLSSWQVQVKKALLAVQEKKAPYDNYQGSKSGKIHSGSTEDIYFGGERIMRALIPAESYCCGATLEVFIRAWKDYSLPSNKVDSALMKEMYSWFFLFDESKKTGCQGGLQLLQEVASVQISNEPLDFPFGAFVQICFDSNNWGSGHSCIFLGWGEKKKYPGKKYMIVWSSNRGYEYLIDEDYIIRDGKRTSGHGVDYFSTSKKGRIFYGAWIE